jgi:Putative addiction module component
LLLSLESEPFDEDVDAAWQEEVERRLMDLDSGRTATVDSSDAIAHVRQSLEQRNRQ